MNITWFGALIGLGLFLVFERKHIAQWRAKFSARRQGREQKDHASTLARALAEAGFFADLTDAEARELRKEIETVGYGDRFYSVYGGNDGRVLILSPDMLTAIMNTPGIRREELPYIRTAEWPYFGMSRDTAQTGS